jgi:hypothetical protein
MDSIDGICVIKVSNVKKIANAAKTSKKGERTFLVRRWCNENNKGKTGEKIKMRKIYIQNPRTRLQEKHPEYTSRKTRKQGPKKSFRKCPRLRV